MMSFTSVQSLIRQREGKNISAGCDRDVLPSTHHVGHWRGFPYLVRFEVPQRASCLGIDSREAAAGLSVKYQASGGRKDARIVRFRRAHLRRLPNDLAA